MNVEYFSLDEARTEIRKRWADLALRKRVEEFLGDHCFVPAFNAEPRCWLHVAVLSPHNELEWFLWCCRYLDVAPIICEYTGDINLKLNPEKRRLSRLRLHLPNGRPVRVNIVDRSHAEKLPLNEVQTKHGESLIKFHRRLLDKSGHCPDIFDPTDAFHKIGKAKEYYLPYLAHFIAHGVLFENFLTDPECNEWPFTRDVVLPAIEKLESLFGCPPMIVRLVPENQTEAETRFNQSYPPPINDFIVKFVTERGYTLVPE